MQILRTHSFHKELKGSTLQTTREILGTRTPAHKNKLRHARERGRRRRGRRSTPTRKPQREEDHSHRAHTASPRPLTRTTRNENKDETKPISRLGDCWRTNYPKPPTHKLISETHTEIHHAAHIKPQRNRERIIASGAQKYLFANDVWLVFIGFICGISGPSLLL